MPPSSAPRLRLDENLSTRLAEQRRRHGFDVPSAQESGLLATSGEEQLEHSCNEHRAISTITVGDFVAPHNQCAAGGKVYWGTVLSSRESIGVVLHRILRLLNSVAAEELKNQPRWLNEFDQPSHHARRLPFPP